MNLDKKKKSSQVVYIYIAIQDKKIRTKSVDWLPFTDICEDGDDEWRPLKSRTENESNEEILKKE